MARRVPPDIESSLRAIGPCGQVLALPGVVAVTKGGHPRERVSAQRIRVTEVVLRAHVLAHPLGRVVQLTVQGEAAQSVLSAILVDQAEECLLLAVQSYGRGRGERRSGDHGCEGN